jgi:hypothetical protein
MQNLLDIEGIRPEQIDKEQFYFQVERQFTCVYCNGLLSAL